MHQTKPAESNSALELIVSIVKAYVAHNSLPMGGLPDLIASVDNSLRTVGRVQAEADKPTLQPAVSVKKSVTPGYLISLEDGRQYKMLKRHLSGRGMTPDQYRQKWNLPRDYPMTAPDYAATRSQLAKAAGLGRKTSGAVAEPKAPPRTRGRPKKSS